MTPFERALAAAQPHAVSQPMHGGRIVTAGDQKVCSTCRAEAKNPNATPPYHPNYRCSKVQSI